MNPLSFSWRLTRRDWRAGELRLLLAALVVAVASIASVGFFVDRMRQALSLEARQLLGADLVIGSDRALPKEWIDEVGRLGLASALTVSFPSMVVGEQGPPQLASVKAVSEGYPLRGAVRVASAPGAPDEAAGGIPAPGTLWVDPQLLQALGAPPGAALELGDARFQAAQVITLEPDRGANFVNFAPRAILRLDELEATGLVQPASRVTWRLLVAGEPAALSRFEAWVQPRLGRNARVETLESGRPELRNTLERAERFLALVALMSALIAAVAIGLASRRFAERHLDGCAVMRAMGIRQSRLSAVLALELFWIGLAGGLVGALLGWLVHFGLVSAISPLIGMPLPMPGPWPALQALAAGLVLLLGCGAWPFLRLAGVPPLRVLRRDLGSAGASPWVALLLALAAFAGLLLWFAGDRKLAAVALGGFVVGGAVFSVLVWLAMRLIAPLRGTALVRRRPALRLALASWSRRQGASVVQTVALAVGLMALMLLTVTRTDLIDSWRRASPPDAPNRFVINIQPDQRDAVIRSLAQAGIRDVELLPMIRGRLVEINGRPVRPEDFDGDRAQRMLDREFNLSQSAQAPAHNRIVEGKWFAPEGLEVSVESGILATLGLKLGDELTFDIAGEKVAVRATSVRKVQWDSMRVNFFMILSPRALRDAPQTLITAFHQPVDAPRVEAALVREHPNLTIFDTGALLNQVQKMLEQVVLAVQFLFLLTLAAGVVVLHTALASSRDERVREAGLMRALGASRAQLSQAQLWELGLSGALAGLLASGGAIAIGWVLAQQVFQFEFAVRWSSLVWGTAAGAVLAMLAGWLSLRGVLRAPPLDTLRAS
ncbi:ABC transporter permease [Quisquiliibacterium transsilvanicum]|uniref:Putative ABC transport system permease protein n=1 Tax=Quisquiliibacterium transsilvanicum TaxID=1549638 RepID=A0A7W8MAM7_9BURK|nr:FtsX-like permease family protein [Quisquiliibacterium transsilvanicum]MBB5273852.1 putative ABC transport system permease protein [Quisquiliibacterium transsilvanicum]